jgi:hypothetical protein
MLHIGNQFKTLIEAMTGRRDTLEAARFPLCRRGEIRSDKEVSARFWTVSGRVGEISAPLPLPLPFNTCTAHTDTSHTSIHTRIARRVASGH